MLPKLQAIYMQGLLPELACPRKGKSPGIREPGIWVSLKIYDKETMRLVEINMIFLKL
jgi:hypothetical protein